MSVTLAVVALFYSTGCVLYEEMGPGLPGAFMYPIAPGIWVGLAVHSKITQIMWVCYAAGIATMTGIGALLGATFDWLCDSSSRR